MGNILRIFLGPYVQYYVILHVWTQNYPQNVGTCPGLPLQLLARNPFFQSDRPEPPLIYEKLPRLSA